MNDELVKTAILEGLSRTGQREERLTAGLLLLSFPERFKALAFENNHRKPYVLDFRF